MSDNGKLYYDQNPKAQLRNWALWEMSKGAFYALIFSLSIGVFFLILWVIGLLLPEESKTAPGPMPFSQIEVQDAPPLVRA